MAYTKYSLTPANNNATPPDGAPEGMLPSAVNDTMRDMMAQIRDVGDGIRNGTYTMTAPVITGGSITGATLTGNTFSNPVITGVSTFAAGTVSAPAITTSGDTNTGIFFPTADTIAFTEGGVEAMRINSSGNVGINSNGPDTKLVVNGASGVTTFTGTTLLGVRVTGATSTNDYSGIDFNTSSASNTQARIAAYFSGSGSYLQFGTSNNYSSGITNTAMTIDFNANVGIGTSSPQQKLHVGATSASASATYLLVTNKTGNTTGAIFGQNAADDVLVYNQLAGGMLFATNNLERMRIDSSGNVGIGTSSPSTRLHVLSSSNNPAIFASSDANNSYLTFRYNTSTTFGYVGNGSGIAGGNSGDMAVRSEANLVFASGGNTERMRIDSSGRLLVGASSSYGSGAIQAFNATASNFSATQITAVDTTTSTAGVGGQIGFYGRYNTGSTDYAWYGGIQGIKENSTNDNTACALTFYTRPTGTAPTERMRITSAGNVGIGTSSPSATLHVDASGGGVIRVSRISSSATNYMQLEHDGTNGSIVVSGANNLILNTNGAERMRIGNSGVLSNYQSTLNGPYIQGNSVTYASNATVNICNTTAGGLIIIVYDQGTGDGGVFWANYSSIVVKIAGDGSATDTGSTFAVYKSAASHTVTFRNRYGISRNIAIGVYSANALF